MKKKVLVALVIVLLIAGGIVCEKKAHEEYLIAKGNEIFGEDYCPKDEYEYGYGQGAVLVYVDSEHPMISSKETIQYKCEICNKDDYAILYSGTPKICSSCANITGRCTHCGKLKNN